MIIPINFKYKYKNYPFSPKATQRSKMLGILTCATMCLVWGLFWCMIVYGILIGFGGSEDVSLVIAVISLIGMVFLIKRIKSTSAIKIEQMAMADLCALQHTDPVSYIQFAGMFNDELSRYYASNRFQTAEQGYNPNPKCNNEQYVKPQNGSAIPVDNTNNIEHTGKSEVTDVSADDDRTVAIETPKDAEQEIKKPKFDDAAGVVKKQFCGQCGEKLKPEAIFCHNCGSKV